MEQHNEQNGTVASAQPFLDAEKAQLNELSNQSQQMSTVTKETAAQVSQSMQEMQQDKQELPPEIEQQLARLAEFEKKEAVEKEEAEKAQKEEEEDDNYVKFSEPYVFEGETFDGIKLDVDDLTGRDIVSAEEEFVAANPGLAAQTPLKDVSKGFLAYIASRASGQPVDFFHGLKGRDFNKVTRIAQVFLLKED